MISMLFLTIPKCPFCSITFQWIVHSYQQWHTNTTGDFQLIRILKMTILDKSIGRNPVLENISGRNIFLRGFCIQLDCTRSSVSLTDIGGETHLHKTKTFGNFICWKSDWKTIRVILLSDPHYKKTFLTWVHCARSLYSHWPFSWKSHLCSWTVLLHHEMRQLQCRINLIGFFSCFSFDSWNILSLLCEWVKTFFGCNSSIYERIYSFVEPSTR